MAKNSFIPLSKLKELKRLIAKTVKSELFLTWDINEEEFKSRKSILLTRDEFPEDKVKYKEQKSFTFVDEDKEEVIDKTIELNTTKVFTLVMKKELKIISQKKQLLKHKIFKLQKT